VTSQAENQVHQAPFLDYRGGKGGRLPDGWDMSLRLFHIRLKIGRYGNGERTDSRPWRPCNEWTAEFKRIRGRVGLGTRVNLGIGAYVGRCLELIGRIEVI